MSEKCFVCKSIGKMRRCSQCKAIKYCSRECQLKDWKRHKTECKEMAQRIEMLAVEKYLSRKDRLRKYQSLPNNVIRMILETFVLEIPLKYEKSSQSNKNGDETYDLFGIFKSECQSERPRKIELIFPCLRIEESGEFSFLKHGPRISLTKLRFLDLKFPNPSLLSFFTRNSRSLSSMTSLRVYIHVGPYVKQSCALLKNLFSGQPQCFPVLLDLSLDIFGSSSKHSKWKLTPSLHPFKSLKKLNFSVQGANKSNIYSLFGSNKSLKNEYLKNLSFLCLQGVSFESEEVIHKLPILEKLILTKCSNLVILPGKKLELFQMQEMHSSDIKRGYARAKNIKELVIKRCQNVEYWLFDHTVNPLSKLVAFRCETLKWSKALHKRFSSGGIQKRLEMLTLCCVNGISDSHLSSMKKMKKLKWLEVSANEHIFGMERYPCTKSVELIRISDNYMCFQENFFQINQFPRLRKLSLSCSAFLTGNNWYVFRNLRELEISDVRVSDTFFKQQKYFPRTLYKMNIEGSRLTGEGWGRSGRGETFNNLRILELKNCSHITDRLFQENSFPVLKDLCLWKIPKIRGLNWKPMKILENMIIEQCESLRTNSIFVSEGNRVDFWIPKQKKDEKRRILEQEILKRQREKFGYDDEDKNSTTTIIEMGSSGDVINKEVINGKPKDEETGSNWTVLLQWKEHFRRIFIKFSKKNAKFGGVKGLTAREIRCLVFVHSYNKDKEVYQNAKVPERWEDILRLFPNEFVEVSKGLYDYIS